MTRAGPSIPVSTKRKTHAIRKPPANNRSASHIACAHPPTFWTLPTAPA